MKKVNIQRDLKSRKAIENNLYPPVPVRERTVNNEPEIEPTHATSETVQGEADNETPTHNEKTTKKRGRTTKGDVQEIPV